MPQGLQVFDASGGLLIDTNYAVLKATVLAEVVASDTALHTVAAPAVAGTVVPSTFSAPGSSSAGLPTVSVDSGTGALSYQFVTAGTNKARVMALSY